MQIIIRSVIRSNFYSPKYEKLKRDCSQPIYILPEYNQKNIFPKIIFDLFIDCTRFRIQTLRNNEVVWHLLRVENFDFLED